MCDGEACLVRVDNAAAADIAASQSPGQVVYDRVVTEINCESQRLDCSKGRCHVSLLARSVIYPLGL